MKQVNMFGQEFKPEESKQYSSRVESPVYEPSHKKPHLLELYDDSKTKRIIREIEVSDIPEEEKAFLIEAAKRHTVFNYEKIADYYAHSGVEVQKLMERSALVIIDFHKAIELGYIKLVKEIRAQYLEDYDQ